MNVMLKRYGNVFTLHAVYYYAYEDDTDGQACVVYVWYIFFISARCIQNLEFAKNVWVYSGMD
jgi:hypothetical protein